ncbi:MAG TPA: 4Fe-4S dicluster domain-containing protein [Candidatus Fraserbacteria bacterium]|nr:4Fe-4S dicluster domain-containing protein [Candidatus Fraserbacteria bacterium]
MAFVITQACIGTKASECEKVCPVDAIHPREDQPSFEQTEQLYIDPSVCIDCGACMAVCPVRAIYPDEDPVWAIPKPFRYFIEKNADYYRLDPEAFTQKYPPGVTRRKVVKVKGS